MTVVAFFPFKNVKLLGILGTRNSHIFIGFGFPWDDRNDTKRNNSNMGVSTSRLHVAFSGKVIITSTIWIWQAYLHPNKLTCPLKRDYFNREYIFQPLIFRGHVSFQGSSTWRNSERLPTLGEISGVTETNSIPLQNKTHCFPMLETLFSGGYKKKVSVFQEGSMKRSIKHIKHIIDTDRKQTYQRLDVHIYLKWMSPTTVDGQNYQLLWQRHWTTCV